MNTNKPVKKVTVIGAGSWGTSIAMVIGESHPNVKVTLWAYEKSVVDSINKIHINSEYLPGVTLPQSISATSDLKDSCTDADVIIIATPSKIIYDLANRLKKIISDSCHVAFLTKGFCKIDDEVLTISQAISRIIPELQERIAAVYGPSHAEEVSQHYHTCLNVGSKSPESRKTISSLLSSPYLQCRETDDIIGVEVGGTLKNPAAIAAGMISILPGCGDNLAGALISEALKEMLSLAEIFGARPETIVDISGVGDLVATALSEHSRNRRFGKDISAQIMNKSRSLKFTDKLVLRFKPDYVISKMSEKLHYLAEGAYAIEPVIELALQYNIPIPVYRSLYEVLLNKKDPSLLIETIKNPGKFDELYSITKIQIKSKSRGLENVKGTAFRDIIVKRSVAKLMNPSGKKDSSEANNILIASLKKYAENRSHGNIRELKIIQGMNPSTFNHSLKKLCRLYTDSIVDSFNPIFKQLFIQYIRFISNIGSCRRRKSLKIHGAINEIKQVKNAANLIYLSKFKTLYDYLTVCFALNNSSLPFPRFFVNKRAVRSKLHRYLIKRTGGFIIDPDRNNNPVYRKVLGKYFSILIEHGVPFLYFPESEPENNGKEQTGVGDFFDIISEALIKHTVEIALVPVEITYNNTDELPVGICSAMQNSADINFSKPIFISDYTCDSASIEALSEKIRGIWHRDGDYSTCPAGSSISSVLQASSTEDTK